MEKKSTFEDVLKIRKGSRKIIRKGNEGWLYDYTMPNGPFTYEVTFQNIIDEKWGDFLQKQKEKQGSTAAMDFMGGGTCFMNLPVDKKLAVRLTDKGSDPFFQLSLQEKELLSKIDVITGDVLSKKTWKEVFVWVEKETAGRGFDLILSRPIGGLLHITFNLDVWYFLIENLWKSLNKNRGTLYTQLPLPNYDLMSVPRGSNAEDLLYFMGVVGKGREKIMVWINNLLGSKSEFETAISDNEGLPTIHNDYSVLRLRKTPGSPLQLPKLENLDKL